MDPFAADVIYYVLLFGSVLFIVFFVKESFQEWVGHLELKFQSEKERAVLEIRVPKDINKTPLAMEFVLNSMQEVGGDGDWLTRLTTGKRRSIFSLEMASHAGEVHFYIWCEKAWIPRIEAHFYAQYPSIELVEVQDYALHYPFSYDTHKMFGFEFGLIQPDPVPIMTYKSYGQDKQGSLEPENQIDPITQTIEALSNIGPGEEIWVQFVCRSHKDNDTEPIPWAKRIKSLLVFPFQGGTKDSFKKLGEFFFGKKTTDWKSQGKKLIKEIRESYKVKGDDGYSTNEMTRLDRLKMDAIAENITKPAYDVGMRTLYIGEKSSFDPGSKIQLMGSAFRQYATGEVYNGIKPDLITSYDFDWQDRSGKHIEKLLTDLFFAYRKRSFMYRGTKEYKYKKTMYGTFVLSTEELATLYHIPGQVAATPTFERIESVTGQAPANLPL